MFQPVNYECFKLFMVTYLEAEIPDDLCQHLFLSFMKRPSVPVLGKECNVKDVAVMASQTACAPVVPQSTDMLEKHGALATDAPGTPSHPPSSKLPHQVLAEKLHGLTGKIHSLGHSRTDSGGGSDAEKRSRAGQSATIYIKPQAKCKILCIHILNSIIDLDFVKYQL